MSLVMVVAAEIKGRLLARVICAPNWRTHTVISRQISFDQSPDDQRQLQDKARKRLVGCRKLVGGCRKGCDSSVIRNKYEWSEALSRENYSVRACLTCWYRPNNALQTASAHTRSDQRVLTKLPPNLTHWRTYLPSCRITFYRSILIIEVNTRKLRQ